MDKRGFNKAFLIVIALALITLAMIYFTVTPRNTESLKKLSQAQELGLSVSNQGSDIKEIEPSEKDNIDNQDTPTDVNIMSPDRTAALHSELQPHKYHADPYIEARSIVSEKAFCFVIDNSDDAKSHVKDSFISSKRLTEFNDMVKHCQTELRTYPILFRELENIYWSMKPDSHIGQLLQEMLTNSYTINSQRDISYQSLIAVLKSKNGPLIADQASLIFGYLSEGEFMPFSTWLNSQNPQYLEQVFQLSLSKLACRYQGGIACEPYGMTMLTACGYDKTACGLDFQSYYKQTILPGMQKDVDLLIEKFEAMTR